MTNVHIVKPKHSNHVTVNSMYKNNNSIITKDETGSYLTLKFNQENRYKIDYVTISTTGRNLITKTGTFTGGGWSRSINNPAYTGGLLIESETYNDHAVCSLSTWGGVTKNINVTPGKKYTLSMMVKATSDGQTFAWFHSHYINGSWTNYVVGSIVTATTADEWFKVSNTFTAVANATMGCYMLESRGGVYYVSELKLEEGTTATEWSAAPEDLTENWSTMTPTEKQEISESIGASISSVNLFSKRYIYGWTLHNQNTFDYQNILNNFRRIGEYENDGDAVNKNYLYSDSQSTAPKPYEHQYTSHSEYINLLDIKTQLGAATIKTTAKVDDLFFLCVTEYGDNPSYQSDVSYDGVSGSVTVKTEDVEISTCSLVPKYTVIPIFDKNIFTDIAIDSATECVNKRKHEKDSILYDMLKIKAISDSLKVGDFGNAIDFWNAFILKKDVEYDECLKEEARYERNKCNCSYIVNYD